MRAGQAIFAFMLIGASAVAICGRSSAAPRERDVSALSCLSAEEREDVRLEQLRLDLSRALQKCANEIGAGTLSFPSGLYRIDRTVKIPSGQTWVGTALRNNSGSRLAAGPSVNEPIVEFDASGGFDRLAVIGSARANSRLEKQACVYIHGTNSVTIANSFFLGCSDLVRIDGTSFDIVIANNKFYSASRYQLYAESHSAQGIDLQIHGNHWLALTDEGPTALGAIKFSGLGSLMWTNDGISEASPNGPLVEFVDAAKLYGGVQISTTVFENTGNSRQPTLYLHGDASKAWSTMHIMNSFIVASLGPAIKGTWIDRFFVFGSVVSSSDRNGSIQVTGAIKNALIDGVNFEASTGAYTPIRLSQMRSPAELTINDPIWNGTAPLVDASALQATLASGVHITGFFGQRGSKALLTAP